MPPTGPTYTGHLPYTDETTERLLNAVTLWVALQQLGMLRVTQYDVNGIPITPGGGFASAIVTGTKTVTTAGTAVQVSAASVPIKGVWVNADLLAGTVVTVGDSGVVGNASGMKGLILTPGNPPIFLQITDLNLLWVDAQANGGKLAYSYLT